MKTSVNAASVAMRSYLSSHHLWAAHHFARLAEGIENDFSGSVRFDIRHRSYVVGAVLDSVAFSEAAVNELFQDVADGHRSYVAVLDQRTCSAMQAYWRESRGRASILEKYQTALGLAGREPLAVGAAPFQSAALVIQLRNLLVHFRPETVSADSARKVESRLKTRFPENVLMAGCGNPFFPDKCLGAGCAAWSINSLKALADEAFRRLAMAPNYQRVAWDDDGAPTQKSGA